MDPQESIKISMRYVLKVHIHLRLTCGQKNINCRTKLLIRLSLFDTFVFFSFLFSLAKEGGPPFHVRQMCAVYAIKITINC